MAPRLAPGSARDMPKLEHVLMQFDVIAAHMPEVQANFMFDNDADAGEEPIALTREFIRLRPRICPVISYPMAYGGTLLRETWQSPPMYASCTHSCRCCVRIPRLPVPPTTRMRACRHIATICSALFSAGMPHCWPSRCGISYALMTDAGIGARAFLAAITAAARLNRRCARLGAPFVYDNSSFPWVDELEREWRTIRGERDSVLPRRNEITNVQGIIAGAASITRDASWKIFVLVAQGVRSPPNIALCPQTWRLVRKIPGLRTAMFSIFEPGKRLPPHRGSYNGVLRLHLGLLVPEPPTSLGIRIGSELRHWREGAVLIFDDSQEHEAWNETNRPRVVLFVDFLKPFKFPADLLNRLLLGIALFTPMSERDVTTCAAGRSSSTTVSIQDQTQCSSWPG
jgi:ornithine lipid ester-linked acyl 2-hydroxylase